MVRFLMVVLMVLAAVGARAEQVRVEIYRGVSVEEAGVQLRRALTAYEAAMDRALPSEWTRVTLQPDGSANFGRNNILVLQGAGGDANSPGLLFVDEEGPHSGSLRVGSQQTLGSLEVIVLSASRRAYGAELMVRAADKQAAALLVDPPSPNPSPHLITGSEQPREIEVDTASPQVAAFSREFLKAFNRGFAPEECARRAREASPPSRVAVAQPGRDYTDPTNIFDSPDHDAPTAAVVTLHLVRGETSALKQLESTMAYDSGGRVPEDPRVTGTSDGDGGTVTYGSPGDRFRAQIRILERTGKVDVNGETLLRVPLNGRSRFSLDGPQGTLSAWMGARPQGRQAVELSIDQRQGDWTVLGALNTQVRVRDGQTVALARNSYDRTETTESQVPILGDIPFLGPFFGNTSTSSQTYSYALYGSVSIE